MKIVRLSDQPALKSAIIDIFFESSTVQTFASEQARADFRARWLDYYIESEPEGVFVAVDGNGKAMGYLTGCFNTAAAMKVMYVDSAKAFEPYYKDYPAHLHINVSAAHRSSGVGAELIMAFENACREQGVGGIHLVTAAGARNVSFYERNGFAEIAQAQIKNRTLLLMGKRVRP